MIIGILISVFRQGIPVGLKRSLTGSILPIIFLICLFLLKAIGGGDIKLISMVGSYIGPDIIYIMIYSFVFGGVLSIFYILRFFNFQAICHSRYSKKRTKIADASKGSGRIHFSLAIFAGTIYYLFKMRG